MKPWLIAVLLLACDSGSQPCGPQGRQVGPGFPLACQVEPVRLAALRGQARLQTAKLGPAWIGCDEQGSCEVRPVQGPAVRLRCTTASCVPVR
jgi:hypothetical protein